MSEGTDYMGAGRQLLELQLAMMRGAMSFMTSGTQRLMQLGLAAAAASAGRGLPDPSGRAGARERVEPAPSPASAARGRHAPAAGQAPIDPPFVTAARLASARKDYVERMQEDVDSILHAFAMAPDTADRMIRAAVQKAERPASGGKEPRAAGPAKPTSHRRRAAARSAEHAR